MGLKVAILRDNNPESSKKWELACQSNDMNFLVIDMLHNDWLDELQNFRPDFCVSRPPGDLQQHKKVFDEKLYFLEKMQKLKVFPGYHETVIYENKASLSYFLKTQGIPHPETFVSYSLKECQKFIKQTHYPIVAKTLIGAAGSGVKIIRSEREASFYVKKVFKTGIRRRYGPNRKTGSPKTWLKKAIKDPTYFFKKLQQYQQINQDVQKGVVLFQQFLPHEYEWRLVKIGESYFAYKKLKIDGQASGSKQFEYGPPPIELLNFTKQLCKKYSFNFMAIDVFHNSQGIFVNELQTIFGHKNSYICKVNGKPGRYIYQNDQWVFEEGDYNTNESYDLRLKTAINLYKKGL